MERKYDVDAQGGGPPLTGMVEGAVDGAPQAQELSATYLDTPASGCGEPGSRRGTAPEEATGGGT